MKRLIGIIIFVNGLLLSGCISESLSEQNRDNSEPLAFGEDIESFASEDLNDSEMSGLIFMREEEKLARDVYNVLYEKWGKRVFNNIAQSEQKHTNAIKVLLDKYEIEDPVKIYVPGNFTNQDLQNLFDTLIIKGDSSLLDALYVGALIEEVDILDIQKELDEHVDNEDIVFVYDNLIRGSYNHLKAFVRNISRFGIEYEPQSLSLDQFNSILNQWFVKLDTLNYKYD